MRDTEDPAAETRDSAPGQNGPSEIENLEQMVDRLEEATRDEERVTIDHVLDTIGRRSFGPILLLAGLITLAPVIGDIPGIPTLVACVVFIVGIQLIFHRDHFWLPDWMLRRSVDRDRLCKALGWLRKPARWVDRLIRRRLTALTGGVMARVIAAVCLTIALAMPAMEFVPFSATGAGAALAAFGLALIANDGLLAALAFAFTAGTVGVVAYNLL